MLAYDTFTDGEPKKYLENINNHLKCPDNNKLVFIENTGHTYQRKESNIKCLSLSRPFIREPNLAKRWQDGDTSPSKCASCNKCYYIINHKCIFN